MNQLKLVILVYKLICVFSAGFLITCGFFQIFIHQLYLFGCLYLISACVVSFLLYFTSAIKSWATAIGLFLFP